jgi:hypothetical protein
MLQNISTLKRSGDIPQQKNSHHWQKVWGDTK